MIQNIVCFTSLRKIRVSLSSASVFLSVGTPFRVVGGHNFFQWALLIFLRILFFLLLFPAIDALYDAGDAGETLQYFAEAGKVDEAGIAPHE